MSLMDIWNLRYASPDLKNCVTVAVAKAAQDILGELDTTTNHAERLVWAKDALVNTKAEAEKFMWGVLSNQELRDAELGDGAEDSLVLSVVTELVNTFAV